MAGDDTHDAYRQVLLRAFTIAAETSERCRPVHLLAALAEGDGPISDALKRPGGDPLFPRRANPPPFREGGGGYLVMQTQQAARQLASERGDTTGPEHLFLAVIDQAEAEAVTLVTQAGLDMGALRTAALDILGASPDLPSITMPARTPAGTLDRPPLSVDDLDSRAWVALCWRQDHLPLHRLRRRSHFEALRHLEYESSWRVASRLGLDDDQRHSLSRHHLARVEQLVAQAKPGMVELRSAWSRPAATMMPGTSYRLLRRGGRPWYRRRWLNFTVGWGCWFSNRWVGLRDRWFRLRSIPDYRGAPQL